MRAPERAAPSAHGNRPLLHPTRGARCSRPPPPPAGKTAQRDLEDAATKAKQAAKKLEEAAADAEHAAEDTPRTAFEAVKEAVHHYTDPHAAAADPRVQKAMGALHLDTSATDQPDSSILGRVKDG